MSERELAEAFGRLRPLCVNIVGFDDLAGIAGRERLPEGKRAEYEAFIRRFGTELAREVIRIADGLNRPKQSSYPMPANDH
nr:hypothetical protein [Methylobacterium sp. NI91]